MLVHEVYIRLGPSSSNSFYCLSIAPKNQGKSRSKSCQPILFLIFPTHQYTKKVEKGGRGISLMPGQSVACKIPPLWLISSQKWSG